MNKRLKIEIALIAIIAIVFLWFIPCIVFCSAELIYSLSVRVFGLILIGVWIFRMAKRKKEEVIKLPEEEEEEFRIY